MYNFRPVSYERRNFLDISIPYVSASISLIGGIQMPTARRVPHLMIHRNLIDLPF